MKLDDLLPQNHTAMSLDPTIKKRIEAVLGISGSPDTSIERQVDMRMAPRFVVLGEVRDQATMEAAIRAAQTGFCLYATMASPSVGHVFQRLNDSVRKRV